MDGVSSRVPYRHLREAELEMVSVQDLDANAETDIDSSRTSNGLPVSLPSSSSHSSAHSRPGTVPEARSSGLKTLILGCMVAAGVQFGWALQLSLLTPYIQTLGIEHAFSSFIWLCGPITGLIVQPCVGIWSDNCHSKYGRRRPFIFVGSLLICCAVTIIGFSADIGYILGDTKEHCRDYKGPRWRAAAVFIIGFWMLDLANNTVQGPARALLADLSGPNQQSSASAIFCSWMAVGNILGFSSGASGQWQRWFPFLTTRACCEACGNLKAAFLVAVVFLMFCTLVTLYFTAEVTLVNKEKFSSDSAPLLKDDPRESNGLHDTSSEKTENGPKVRTEVTSQKVPVENLSDHDLSSEDNRTATFDSSPSAVLVNLLTSLRHLPHGMHSVLIVMSLTWLSWFPFFLFDTDWMGREVYHGNPKGNTEQMDVYHRGVRAGAFGLLLNSVVLMVSSFLIEPMCRRLGPRLVWALSNFTVCICMVATTIISLLSLDEDSKGVQHIIEGNGAYKVAALVLFALLGFPLSITYSVPYSMTAELTAGSGGGQGLATGVLNLAIVIPQMIVSLGAGPWDALFGGGNIPAFVLASVFSLVAGIISVLKLPRLSSSSHSSGFHGFG
ncbi:unnamed protein product [Spirodela intermedia]|uniref:Uncharacterized protein n=1 Tax=Spirodela intermedia TaxID=51605 RepID=A0A7I8L015_SPIIN|nr:unnamed protein product [Spirodela intermedia]